MRLAYPVSVIVTTTSSRAIRSSSLTSPSAATILRAAVVAVLLDDFGQLVAHDGALALRLGQDVFQFGDLGLDLGQIVDDALALQCSQPAQLHVQDRLRLDFVDVEQLDQALARVVDGLRRPDQRDHLVERVERLDQAAQDVGPFVGLAQPVGGAPDDDVELVVDVMPDQLVEAQRAGHAVDDRQHVGAEAGLQLGVLVEVVQHHLGHGVALELDDDPHARRGRCPGPRCWRCPPACRRGPARRSR